MPKLIREGHIARVKLYRDFSFDWPLHRDEITQKGSRREGFRWKGWNGGKLMCRAGFQSMLMELAKPVTFIFCIVSLYALFINAFLIPSNDVRQQICDCLGLLMVAAGTSLISGLIFQRAMRERCRPSARLFTTLPVQLFFWSSSIMLVLFIVSWYLENHCVFYRDVRF